MTDFSARTIVITAAAVQARRDGILAQAGIGFVESLALRAITTNTPAPTRPEIISEITTPNVITEAQVAEALDGLSTSGLVTASHDTLRATPQGQAVASQVADANARSSAELLADFTPDELRTTQRVLELITERAANPVTVAFSASPWLRSAGSRSGRPSTRPT